MPRLMPALCLVVGVMALPAAAFPTDTSTGDSAEIVATARDMIDAGDFAGALAYLNQMNIANPRNADILNLLGFASRKSGDLDAAARWYGAALSADPDHLGTLEYQGEMFLQLGDRAAAEANLARLTELCGTCEEQADLAEAIGAAD